MNKAQITAIVNAMLELRKRDQDMQKASDIYHDALYPDCHNPFLVWVTDWALKILDLVEPEISEWISYFIYEAPGLKRNDPDYDVVVTFDNVKWKMNTKEDLITFLQNAYHE